MTVRQFADLHGFHQETARRMVLAGRIEGAQKIDGVWQIPDNAPWPEYQKPGPKCDDQKLKAWHVASDFSDFYGGHMLVWAETSNKARHLHRQVGWYEDEYQNLRAKRAPLYDGLRDVPGHLEDNDDLPADVKPFYGTEAEWYGEDAA